MKWVVSLYIVFLPYFNYADTQVATVTVREQSTLIRELLGKVIAPRRQTVAAQSNGVINSIRLEMGTAVVAGQVIVEIESSEQQAFLEIARRELESAEVELKLRSKSLRRARENHRQRAISEARFDEVETAFTKASATRALMASRVLLQQTRLVKFQIRAPFDGQLVRSTPVIGQYVRPGDAVFEIVNLDIVRLSARFTSSEIAGVVSGEFTLECQAKPLQIFAISPAGQEDTGLTYVETSSCQETPRPGQHVAVNLLRNGRVNIPEHGIRRDEKGEYVFVVEEGGSIIRQQPGELKIGQRVVVLGAQRVHVGDIVEAIEIDSTMNVRRFGELAPQADRELNIKSVAEL